MVNNLEEQQKTDWMTLGYLSDFLDPHDQQKTLQVIQ
ncbi:DUF1698 domain-containing protein [Gilliamella sp. A7]